MKRQSSESDTDKPSTSTGISHKEPNMAFEKTQKRVGKRPGRKPSKIDMKAKLERSRQSARECRARKKLRYQYLEELVSSREKAVFSLRDEVEMYKKWCSDLDRGVVPEGLLKMVAQEDMRHAAGDTPMREAQSKGDNPHLGQQSGASGHAMLTSMHRNSRSFEEMSQSSSLSSRPRSDSTPNLAAALANNSSRIFSQASTNNATSAPDFTALVYKDFNPHTVNSTGGYMHKVSSQGDGTSKSSNTNSRFPLSLYPVSEHDRCTTSAPAIIRSSACASWAQSSEGQYSSRQLSRTNPATSFSGSQNLPTQNSHLMFKQEVNVPVTTVQLPTDYSQYSSRTAASMSSRRGVSGALGISQASQLAQFQKSRTGHQESVMSVASQRNSGRLTTQQEAQVSHVSTCSSAVPTTQTVSLPACTGAELTASISEPIPHWYSFLDDLESTTFSARQGGAFSAAGSTHSGSGSGVSTPSSGGSPYSMQQLTRLQQQLPQPQKQHRQQKGEDGTTNIPTIISDLLVRRSPNT